MSPGHFNKSLLFLFFFFLSLCLYSHNFLLLKCSSQPIPVEISSQRLLPEYHDHVLVLSTSPASTTITSKGRASTCIEWMDFHSLSKNLLFNEAFSEPFSTGPQSACWDSVVGFSIFNLVLQVTACLPSYSNPSIQHPIPSGSLLILLNAKAISSHTLHVPYTHSMFNNNNNAI